MIPTHRGRAIPVITLPPDWSMGLTWRQRYSTTVTEALDTTEARQARVPRPLYSLTYPTFARGAAVAALRSILERSEDLPVACPLWPMAARLITPASMGAESLDTEDTADCLFDVFSQFAVLWERFDHYEVVEVGAVLPGGATLLAPLARSYSVTALLVPLAYGHVPRASIRQVTDEHGRWECRFEERFHRLHDQSVPEDEPPSPSLFGFDIWLNGVPVATLRPGRGFDGWLHAAPYVDQRGR